MRALEALNNTKPEWIGPDLEACMGVALFLCVTGLIGWAIYRHFGGPGLMFALTASLSLIGAQVEPDSPYVILWAVLAGLCVPLMRDEWYDRHA